VQRFKCYLTSIHRGVQVGHITKESNSRRDSGGVSDSRPIADEY
jgi:hypothetical protein